MKDPASVEAQQRAENELEAIGVGITVAILAIIVKRLQSFDDKTTVVNAYASMPEDLKAIQAAIERGDKALTEKVNEIFERMAKGNDAWAKRYYDAAKLEQLGFADNLMLKELYDSGLKNAIQDVRSLVNTSALGIADADGVWMPLRDAYTKIVGQAAVDMVTGKEAGEKAVQKAVDSLVRYGVRVKYPNTTRDLYGAVRMNVMDAYRQSMVAMRMQQGLEFGADGVEVSAHSPCAPDHEPYQGRQFSFESFNRIQDALDRDIVTGANCMHTTYPVILGMSPAISNSKLRKMNEDSWKDVTVTGLSGKNLTMTRYEASQYQRRIENAIRQANVKQYVTGEDMGAYIKRTKAAYRAISAQAGLPTMLERTRVYVI